MRYKDLPKESFTYEPAEGLPGLVAIPITDNSKAVARWQADGGDETLAINYPLTPQSVVFDVGGYLGDWSAKIIDRHDPFVYIFEPVKSFYDALVKRFVQNHKVRVFNFGLSDSNRTVEIGVNKDGSSLYRSSVAKERIELVDIEKMLRDCSLSVIDLMSINCEGGEYPLLLRLLEVGPVLSIQNIQVQFHTDYPNALYLRDKIRWWLRNTHDESYSYPFVWESWKIRK